ncbi:MAG: cation transporter [Thermoanaerobaculia bacterium]
MQKTTFTLAKMDCPSEEQLVRMKLEGRDEVRALLFDLEQRRLDVVHSGDPETLARELKTLDLGSSLVASVAIEQESTSAAAHEERRLLWQVLLINLLFFVVEVVAGFLAHSMGLVADSLDMLADAFVYGLSLYAVGRTARHKGGVAAVAGVLQLMLALLGLAETVRRFVTPQETPAFGAMIAVSLLALAGNATCLYLLQKSRSREAHMQASMIFTSNDVIANAGVIVAGALVLLTSSRWPDLVVGVAIFLLVGRGAVRILRLARA